MERRRHWLIITSEIAARDLARADWRAQPLGPTLAARPAAGDRIAVLRAHRPRYLETAVFIGTADVRGDSGTEIEIRHRFVAPVGHEVPVTSVRHLLVSNGWTHERLGALMGVVVPVSPQDYERIEDALRVVALAYGPKPSRPMHRMPRTPGRRRLISARLLNRRPSPAR